MRGKTGNKFTYEQLRTWETSSLNPFSEVQEEKNSQPSTKSSLQTTGTQPSKKFILNVQIRATPTNSVSPKLNSSTGGMKSTTAVQFKVTTSPTTGVTSQTTNPTTTRRVFSMLNSTQSQDKEKTLPSKITSDKMTHSSKSTTLSTKIISTTITSTNSVENKSTSTIPFTDGDAIHFTGLYKTSFATTNTRSTQITEKRQDPAEKTAPFEKGTKHSNAVAGLIGGALIMMMVGFLVIYIKKKALQRQQIITKDWAGPSPFLEGGADNGHVTLRSSNRISLNSFLPQRLSKRLSLLPETDEELQDMAPGTTFGNKHKESTFSQEMDGNDMQGTNGTAIVVLQMESKGDASELVTNSVSVS